MIFFNIASLFAVVDEISIIERLLDYFLDNTHPWRGIITIAIILFLITIYLLKHREELSIFIRPISLLFKKIKRVNQKGVLSDDFIDYNYVNRPNKIFVPNEEVIDSLAEKIINNPMICVVGLAGVGKTTIVRQLCYSKKLNHFEYKYEIDFEGVNSPIIEKKETAEDAFKNAKNIFFTKFNVDHSSGLESFVKNTFKKPSLLFIDNYEQITANNTLDSKIRNELIRPFINSNFHIVITSRDEVTDFESFTLDELKNVKLENLNSIDSFSKEKILKEFPAIKLFFQIHNKCKKEKKDKNRDLYNHEDIKIISRLCHKVSNLPLGIMILATRSVEFSVKEILDNLQEALLTNLPVSFSNTSDRQRNLYNAFLWSFNLLSEEEQRFFAHLTFYKNSTLITNIPKWISHKNQGETLNTIEKLYSQSLINRTEDPSQKLDRYELYFITREMFSQKMRKENISLNIEYCEEICRKTYHRLTEIDSLIFEPQTEIINYKEIVTEVRLDLENIIGFIEWCSTHRKDLAVDILIKTENILNEIGPYIFLNELFPPLLDHYKSGVNRARILLAKARVMKSSDHRYQSEVYIDEAISILEKEKSINTLLGNAYSIGAYLYGELDKFDKRKRIIDRVMSFSEDQKKAISTLNFARIILEKGRLHEKLGETKLAVASFQESIESLKGYNIQLGRALNYAALFFWRIGEAEKAEEYFFEAIKRYSDLGDSRWILGFKTNIGLLFADMNKIEEGKKYTFEASNDLEKEGPFGWYLVNLMSQGRLISRVSRSEEDYNKSELLLLKAYEGFKTICWAESMILSIVELAEINFKHKKFEIALNWSGMAIEECKASNMSKSMRYFHALTINALCNHKLKNFDTAKKLADKARALLNEVEGNNWLIYKICSERFKELDTIDNGTRK